MRVRIVTTQEELEPLRDNWDEVVGRSASGSPFLSFDWVTTWWGHFGGARQLLVLLAEDDDGLAALAPLALARYRVGGLPARVVEFIGAPLRGRRLATCLDVAIARSPGDCRAGFSRALLEHSHRWDLCAFHGVPAGSEHFGAMAETDGPGLTLLPASTYEVPCLDPRAQDWEGYLSGRSRSFRYWLRRTEGRALAAHLGSTTRVADAAGLEAILPELCQVCAASWKATQGRGLFLDGDPAARFLTDYLRRTATWGDLLLTSAACAGRVVAYQLSFFHSGKLWFYDTAYNQGYEQAAPGFQLFADMIRTGFRSSVTRIDLGPGLHPYKLRWAEVREPRVNWLGFHGGWRSRLLARAADAALAMRRHFRRRRAEVESAK